MPIASDLLGFGGFSSAHNLPTATHPTAVGTSTNIGNNNVNVVDNSNVSHIDKLLLASTESSQFDVLMTSFAIERKESVASADDPILTSSTLNNNFNTNTDTSQRQTYRNSTSRPSQQSYVAGGRNKSGRNSSSSFNRTGRGTMNRSSLNSNNNNDDNDAENSTNEVVDRVLQEARSKLHPSTTKGGATTSGRNSGRGRGRGRNQMNDQEQNNENNEVSSDDNNINPLPSATHSSSRLRRLPGGTYNSSNTTSTGRGTKTYTSNSGRGGRGRMRDNDTNGNVTESGDSGTNVNTTTDTDGNDRNTPTHGYKRGGAGGRSYSSSSGRGRGRASSGGGPPRRGPPAQPLHSIEPAAAVSSGQDS